MSREFILPVAVIAALASMVVPLPTWLVDLLLVGNLIFSLLLLLNSLSIQEPLKLSSLPTMLLLATLYRLSLNVATTRLILGRGEAGRMIEAFGSLMVGGSFVVGLVVFLVISFVQFVVIAKGSERVAEVAARFTLDALPGKQMSIDADIRAGLLDFESARAKRQELQTESRFYGALDGAMKFIKGDAIAGLAIVLINIVGGLLVGVFIHGLEISDAVSRYTVLTVGDGLLAQIPALLSSLAAGMVVTRVGRGENASLARELTAQLGQSPKVSVLTGGAALLLACSPGTPTLVLLGCSAALIVCGMRAAVRTRRAQSEPSGFKPKLPPLIELELGTSVARELAEGDSVERLVHQFRAQVFQRSGVILPAPQLTLSSSPGNGAARAYCVKLRGVARRRVPEAPTGKACDVALADLVTVATGRLVELIDDSLTRQLLGHYEKECSEIVSSVIPSVISVTQLTTLIRGLVRESVPIINFDMVLQAVAEHGPRLSSDAALLEEVRVVLKGVITERFSKDGVLPIVTVDPSLDLALTHLDKDSTDTCSDYLSFIADALDPALEESSVLVVSRRSRLLVRESLEARGKRWAVLALDEISEDVELRRAGHIALTGPISERVITTFAA